MIDRKPSAIVRPTSIADVMQSGALRAGTRNQGDGAGRRAQRGGEVGGGWRYDDRSVADAGSAGGRRPKRTALAQGGATWGDLIARCEEIRTGDHGRRDFFDGSVRLTLGGGIGWLMGKHGLSCDNVISADLVNADGNHLSVSATQNEDLFWAIRGGGGNFGIVTALEFQPARSSVCAWRRDALPAALAVGSAAAVSGHDAERRMS